MTTDKAGAVESRRPAVGAGEAWAFGGAVAYALTNIFSRIASITVDPMAAPVFRLVPTLAIAWTQVARSQARWNSLIPKSTGFVGWRPVLVLFLGGALGSAIGTVLFFLALQVGGVVLTAPVLATNILWSAIIAAVFLGERLNAHMLAGIVVAVLGVALLGLGRAGGAQVVPEALAAIPLALVTAMSWATAANCTRYALTRGVDKYPAIALSQTFGVVVLIVFLFVTGRGDRLWTTAVDTIGVLLLAGILSAIALICDAHALSLTTVASALTISVGTNPVISTVLAALFLGEELKPLMALGTLLTVAGVVYVQLTKVKSREPGAI
jgi:drug/metabolite transporter (DMT)-like permease